MHLLALLLPVLLSAGAVALPSAGTPPPLPAFRFATSFGTHMVLHQAPKTPVVWGYCDPATCASVKVTLQAEGAPVDTVTTVAAQTGGVPGTWLAKLPATPGSDTPHTVTATDGSSKAEISDVLFGDVWVCSGQSNMAFLLENAYNGSAMVADAGNHPTIRLFTSKKTSSHVPLLEQPVVEEIWSVSSAAAATDDHFATNESCPAGGTPPPCTSSWRCPHCTPESEAEVAAGAEQEVRVGAHMQDDNWLYMSAVCYIFGREIQAHTGKPLGLVNTNWGGTPVEFWMSDEAEANCASQRKPSPAGGAYNGMVKPILNMTITGAIWYQGESNQGDPYTGKDRNGLSIPSYGCRFPAMIADWRAKWAAGSAGTTSDDFPFGFVNLAPWTNPNNAPAGIRWAQSAGYGYVPNPAMPNTFTAIAFDLTDYHGPYGSVHIRDKSTVGKRLAQAGIAQAYGSTTTYWQGPTVESAVLSGGKITVTFNNTGSSGIAVKTAVSKLNSSTWEVCSPGRGRSSDTGAADPCALLAVGGNGTGWKQASVTASSRTTVTVSLTDTTAISMGKGTSVLLRYGWSAVPFDYQRAGLYAKAEGLPAGPFVIKAM